MKNDTHGVSGAGWIGFDLDGTLARYDGWKGIDNIGTAIKPMVDLMKRLHNQGVGVKVLTARVSPRPNPETRPNPYGVGHIPNYAKPLIDGDTSFYDQANWIASNFISDWCIANLGFLPRITHEKDHLMITLYDDRVKQVVPNIGLTVEELAKSLAANYPSFIDLLKTQAMSIKKNHPATTGTQRAERDRILDMYEKAISDAERRYSNWLATQETV